MAPPAASRGDGRPNGAAVMALDPRRCDGAAGSGAENDDASRGGWRS
jgi:hypothetical protein